MAVCVYCGKTRGRRACPALGGYICSSCCGRHRGIKIHCPTHCKYFKAHELYQRQRLSEEYHQAWLRSTEKFYKQNRIKLLDFMLFLELLIYQYYREHTAGTDGDLLEALRFVKRRFSPIEVIEMSGSALGVHLWEGVQEYLKGHELNDEEALEGVEAVIHFLEAYAGANQHSRRLLQGLLGHVERHFKLSEELKKAPELIETPGIITPAELLESPSRRG